MEIVSDNVPFLVGVVLILITSIVIAAHYLEGLIFKLIEQYSIKNKSIISKVCNYADSQFNLKKLKEISKQYGVSVRLINTTDECVANINQLLLCNPRILGFDCEWKPYFGDSDTKNSVSLLQISNEKICLLIRLKSIFESENGIPSELKNLLLNSKLVIFICFIVCSCFTYSFHKQQKGNNSQ